MKRRKFISNTAALSLGATMTGCITSAAETVTKPKEKRYQNGRSPWPICLDTATIRTAGSLEKKVDIAIAAGFDAIEPSGGNGETLFAGMKIGPSNNIKTP